MNLWKRLLHSHLFIIIAAIGISLFLYWPVLDAYVLGDDLWVLMNGCHTQQMLKSWHGDWFTRTISNDISLFYRPVTITSIWLESLLWGKWPPGFHFTNILLHGLCSGLVFVLVWKLFPEPSRYQAGFVAGLIFLFHARHCEAIAPICSRQDLLAALWILCTACLHATALKHTGHRALWYRAVALLAYSLALLCKETALAAPLWFIGLEWLFGGIAGERLFQSLKRTARRSSGYIILMVVYIALRGIFLGQFLGRADYIGGIPSLEVAGGSFLKVIAGLLLVVPVNLAPAWTFLYAQGTAAGLIALAILALLLPWLLLVTAHFKPGWRLPALGITVWLGLYIPALSVGSDPITTAGDRHMYAASIGLSLVVASFCLLSSSRWAKFLISLFTILFCILSIIGLRPQTHAWQSIGRLALDTMHQVKCNIDISRPGTPIILLATPHYVKDDIFFIEVFNISKHHTWLIEHPERFNDFYTTAVFDIHDLDDYHITWQEMDTNTLKGTITNGTFYPAAPTILPPSTSVAILDADAREVQISFPNSANWIMVE